MIGHRRGKKYHLDQHDWDECHTLAHYRVKQYHRFENYKVYEKEEGAACPATWDTQRRAPKGVSPSPSRGMRGAEASRP